MRTLSVLVLTALSACAGASSAAPPPARPSDPDACAVAVRVEELETPEDPEDVVPRMVLTVVRICERDGTATAALPPEAGVCTPAAPERGAIAAATCWWAGAGSVVEVVRRGDALVAMRTTYDEETPPGVAVEVASVPLPAGSEATPLVP